MFTEHSQVLSDPAQANTRYYCKYSSDFFIISGTPALYLVYSDISTDPRREEETRGIPDIPLYTSLLYTTQHTLIDGFFTLKRSTSTPDHSTTNRSPSLHYYELVLTPEFHSVKSVDFSGKGIQERDRSHNMNPDLFDMGNPGSLSNPKNLPAGVISGDIPGRSLHHLTYMAPIWE